ncbi:MAG: thermonuclease family protein [Desulfopila sp.]
MEICGKKLTFWCVVVLSSSLLLALPLFFFANVVDAWAGQRYVVGMVSKVRDGDSFHIKSESRGYEVRLWGIDCPEHGQPYGNAARKLSRGLGEGRLVQVLIKDWDQYGRIVGIVTVDGLVVNEELVRQGSAWVYDRYCRDAVCDRWRQLEKKARAEGLGLWARRQPIPPWQWRRSHR